MLRRNDTRAKVRLLDDWFVRKPGEIRELFDHFVREFKRVGKVTVRTAKTMIIIATPRKGIAYMVMGKSFVHVVFPFKQAYPDNLCFQKIARVPGAAAQFNHHLRLFDKKAVNSEVKKFMRLAYEEGT